MAPDEIIEEEIEVKSGTPKTSTYVYTISSDSDEEEQEQEEEEEKEIKIIKRVNSKIAFSSKDGKKKPLFIVDGKEVANDKFVELDPDSIKSVTVLKDKAAIKKYGDKGKNGVVIVETKKNKKE